MSRENGFLAVRIVIALCVALLFILWAAAQLSESGTREIPDTGDVWQGPRRPASAPGGFKDYLVVWNSPSNVWLGGEAGAAAGVSMIDAGYSHGVALHDDGSVTGVGVDPDTGGVIEQRFPSAGAVLACAGALGDTTVLGFDGALRRVSGAGGLLGFEAQPGNVTELVSGEGFTLALRNNGTVLGLGADCELPPPDGLNSVAWLDAGPGFCMALRHNGSVEVWGDARVATNIASHAAAVSAARRGGHCLALNRDGTVTAWGEDGEGQCRVPAGLSGVTAVAAGGFHSVALRRDGTVACWGLLKGAPPLLTNAVAVSASYLDACALTADGTVAIWGRGCPFGGVRLSARTPGACEILDAAVVDCGVYMAVVRARDGLLEGDADGDAVPSIEEVFLLGTDPLVKDAGAYAPVAVAAATAHAPSKEQLLLRGIGVSVSMMSFEYGTTYYADASKEDDGGDGLGWESAKRTIQAAVDAAQPGDTVLVTNGIYDVGLRVMPGEIVSNRLVITNGVLVKSVNGAASTVIRGSGPEYYDTAEAVRCVYLTDGVLDGFTLEDGATLSFFSYDYTIDCAGGALFMGCALEGTVVRNCIIRDSVAYNGGGVKGDYGEGGNGRMENCLFVGNTGSYGAAGYRCAMGNCTVTGNGASSSAGGVYYGSVTNSIVWGNSSGWESPNCHCCLFGYSCSDPLYFGEGNTVDESVFADPLFTDAGNGDFSLLGGSPCVDAGDDSCVTADSDLVGNLRIQGGAVDMGAFESLCVDTDGDGVLDYLDAFPQDAAAWVDTDGDGRPDELHGESQSVPPLVEDTDDDNDGLFDWWEELYSSYGFDPLVSAPADSSDLGRYGDADGDGLGNVDESKWGADPFSPDTDGDGLSDGAETEVPFLTLWDAADGLGSVFTNCLVAQVTASDTARAALLRDGSVVVFTGSGAGLKAYTNGACGAVEIDATESWIAARTAAGRVVVWPAATGSVDFADAGVTNVTGISCGYRHLLALHDWGAVTCLTNAPSGAPAVRINNFCKACTNAVSVSAGVFADAAVFTNGTVLLGTVFSTAQPALKPPAYGWPAFAAAGTNRNFVVLTTNGQADAYYGSSYTRVAGPTGALFVAAGGCSNMVAVLANGSNAVFSAGKTTWSHTAVTNGLSDARDLWWKRDCRLAVTDGGCLLPLAASAPSARRLDYFSAAATPRGLRLGIAAACSGTCPTNMFSDADVIPDGWEVGYGLDPRDAADQYMDSDEDGLTNNLEYASDTDPFRKDTDGDGYEDGWEVGNGFDPLDPGDTGADPDGDGLTDAREHVLGSDRNDYDSDGDGLSDGAETEVPFLTLWDTADGLGSVFTNCQVAQVTASDTARAALLRDGSVVVFTGSGAGLKAYTNGACGAVEIDATESWIAARTAAGRVVVWPAATGSVDFADAGVTNVTGISCGYRHLLALHGWGAVTCLTNAPSGAPAVRANTFCQSCTNAVSVSAGVFADAAVFENGTVLLGTVFSTAQPALKPPAYGWPAFAAAGTNRNFVVLTTDGQADAYYGSSYTRVAGPTGALFIAAGGCSNMVAVLANGSNAVFSAGKTTWSYTAVTNRLSDARHLWWKRDCRLAVTDGGCLLPLSAATPSDRGLDFCAAAVTPRGLRLGIAAACSGTCATNASTDADGLPDGWEVYCGLDPRDASDLYLDSDSDGLTNAVEYATNTDPLSGDSDGDGLGDGWEFAYGFNPLVPASDAELHADSDGDGLDTMQESDYFGDPTLPDTDGDGLGDGAETVVPFLTLWSPADRVGRVFSDCRVVQVAASDTLRAALLTDGRVVVFAGDGASLKAQTNACDGIGIDATESWIAARLANGDLNVWRETEGGSVADSSMGFTNVVEISGGYAHLLVRHADGRVTCIKKDALGCPVAHSNAVCSAVGTNAVRVAAGTAADAVILGTNRLSCVCVGDALGTSAAVVNAQTSVVDVAAGSNNCWLALLADGRARAYNSGVTHAGTDPTGTLFIAAGGGRTRLAVLSDGRNATLASGATSWSYNTAVTGRLSDARSLWWRRDCGLAVTNSGVLLPLAAVSAPLRGLDYRTGAATPRGLGLGIAAACTGTSPATRFSDADAKEDGWELENGFDPRDGGDLAADDDGDRLGNLAEWERGTQRRCADTDGDGLGDGWEVAYGFNPLVQESEAVKASDPDGDGLDNLTECSYFCNPYARDSDHDGLSDGAETVIPFLTLWDTDGQRGRMFDCEPVQVTASDDMRAARLEDGRVVVFAGSGSGLTSRTNDCAAAELDATDEWIVARTANGRVLVCGSVSGVPTFSDIGLSDAEEVSCGHQHFLVRRSDGSVTCMKSLSGVPTYYANALCTAVGTGAVAISAGRDADAVVLSDSRVWVGSALAADTNMMRRVGPYAGGVEVRAGRAYRFVGRKLSDRTCFSLYGKTDNRLYYTTYMTEAAYRVEAGSSTNLICLLDNGGNAVMNEFIYNNNYASEWKYDEFSEIGNARDLWWKLDCHLAVTAAGSLLPLSSASASGCLFDFRLAAVTTGTGRRGIAAAVARTRADLADTDGDGVPDGAEVALGMEPTVHSGVQPDSDTDGLPDWWETLHGLDPQSASDASADSDGDGLASAQEYAANTGPRTADTDGDGRPDGADDDPLVPDSDGDGLCDAREALLNTDPADPDSDNDGMPDGWEVANRLNPLAGDAHGDFDGDGLDNFAEYENGSRADLRDTDGDLAEDDDEVLNGSDPNNAADGGQPPPAEDILTLPFRLDGDWAAWEMTIASLGPSDTRTLKFSMGSPGDAQARTSKLHRGNSYRVTLRWLGSGEHTSPYWYCWGAQVGGMPAAATYNDYSGVRLAGVAETIFGDGWFADNADGLLTTHVHMNDNGGGNVAEGLEATLCVLKVDFTADPDTHVFSDAVTVLPSDREIVSADVEGSSRSIDITYTVADSSLIQLINDSGEEVDSFTSSDTEPTLTVVGLQPGETEIVATLSGEPDCELGSITVHVGGTIKIAYGEAPTFCGIDSGLGETSSGTPVLGGSAIGSGTGDARVGIPEDTVDKIDAAEPELVKPTVYLQVLDARGVPKPNKKIMGKGKEKLSVTHDVQDVEHGTYSTTDSRGLASVTVGIAPSATLSAGVDHETITFLVGYNAIAEQPLNPAVPSFTDPEDVRLTEHANNLVYLYYTATVTEHAGAAFDMPMINHHQYMVIKQALRGDVYSSDTDWTGEMQYQTYDGGGSLVDMTESIPNTEYIFANTDIVQNEIAPHVVSHSRFSGQPDQVSFLDHPVVTVGAISAELALSMAPGYDFVDCAKEFFWKPFFKDESPNFVVGLISFTGLCADAGYLTGVSGVAGNLVAGVLKVVGKFVPEPLLKLVVKSFDSVLKGLKRIFELIKRTPGVGLVEQISKLLTQWRKLLDSPLSFSVSHVADAIDVMSKKAARHYVDKAAEGLAFCVKAGKRDVVEGLIETYADDAAEATADVLRKLSGAGGSTDDLVALGDDAVDGVGKFIKNAGESTAAGKTIAEAVLDLADAADPKKVFNYVHAWSDANVNLTGTIADACDGMRRWVDETELGAQELANAFKELGGSTGQGYIRSAGKNLDAGVDHGLDRVKDSLDALKATPKTGGVDDVVSGSLGSEISSMKELHAIRNLEPALLTPAQQARLTTIREALGTPTAGTRCQRVIHVDDIDDYLTGNFDDIRSFISKSDDVSDLDTVSKLKEGLRLDYPNGYASEAELGIIEFDMPDGADVSIPYGNTHYPGTANGFSGTRMGKVVPESSLDTPIGIPEGARIYWLDDQGNKVLFGVYHDGGWIQQ